MSQMVQSDHGFACTVYAQSANHVIVFGAGDVLFGPAGEALPPSLAKLTRRQNASVRRLRDALGPEPLEPQQAGSLQLVHMTSRKELIPYEKT